MTTRARVTAIDAEMRLHTAPQILNRHGTHHAPDEKHLIDVMKLGLILPHLPHDIIIPTAKDLPSVFDFDTDTLPRYARFHN